MNSQREEAIKQVKEETSMVLDHMIQIVTKARMRCLAEGKTPEETFLQLSGNMLEGIRAAERVDSKMRELVKMLPEEVIDRLAANTSNLIFRVVIEANALMTQAAFETMPNTPDDKPSRAFQDFWDLWLDKVRNLEIEYHKTAEEHLNEQ